MAAGGGLGGTKTKKFGTILLGGSVLNIFLPGGGWFFARVKGGDPPHPPTLMGMYGEGETNLTILFKKFHMCGML